MDFVDGGCEEAVDFPTFDDAATRSAAQNEIEQLFEACDLNNSGYIEQSELASICTELSSDEVNDVFLELDKDGDGRISISEFTAGFRDIGEALVMLTRQRRRLGRLSLPSNSEDKNDAERSLLEFIGAIDEGLTALSCQEHVCELYQSLHQAEIPHLLAQFENIILAVIRDIRQHQVENERLERSYKREKDQHSRHLRQMEEEMELQMQRVESRVRKEERERSELEREDLKTQLESEIKELQANLSRLQKLDSQLHRSPDVDIKARNTELNEENRGLKSSLTDAQTQLAIVRSELAALRTQYEEKTNELNNEKETLVEYIKEQDNLTRQVHLLHDANKKLHDTNDDLRAALEGRPGSKRSFISRPSSRRRDSLEFADLISSPGSTRYSISSPLPPHASAADTPLPPHPPGSHTINTPGSANSSLADELSMLNQVAFDPYMRRLLPAQESCEVDSIPEDVDSGHSTLRDSHDIDSEYEPNSIEDDLPYLPRKRNRMRRQFDSTTESELDRLMVESGDEMDHDHVTDHVDGRDTEIELDGGGSIVIGSGGGHMSRPGSACSRSSRNSFKRSGSIRRKLPAIPQVPKQITGEPERMYKVVLAGDAAVGKSSFILRLCKNKFVNNLSSTLGVDFQTKTLEVDGRVIALQLWDTAGQERFRSIAKSYFRRADGVLLLYDCTYERSFINVREWINAIEDASQKKIPIMLVANKTDIRDEYEQEDPGRKGIVRREDGQKLAKSVDALFIETSAKDGDNVHESCVELARILRTNEDLEVKSVGLKLQDMKVTPEKKACCGQ